MEKTALSDWLFHLRDSSLPCPSTITGLSLLLLLLFLVLVPYFLSCSTLPFLPLLTRVIFFYCRGHLRVPVLTSSHSNALPSAHRALVARHAWATPALCPCWEPTLSGQTSQTLQAFNTAWLRGSKLQVISLICFAMCRIFLV